ncbi:MAG: hypothetical protein HYY93_01895 [Planctomycetes bacterium]|nr:hypothetical protein [Planctomycetota bacterium]
MRWVRHTVDGIVWKCALGEADWLRSSGILSLAAGLGAGEVPHQMGSETRLEVRKDVALKRVVRLGTIVGGETKRLLVKVYKPRRGIAGLRQRLGRSEADREAEVAEELAARGVSCVVPLALGRAAAQGLGRPSLLLFEEVAGAPLDRYLRGESTSDGLDQRPRSRLSVCRAVGAFARGVHDAGVFQDDFDPNNILVRARTSGGGDRLECVLVDYERVKLMPLRTVQAWAREKSDRLFQQRCWSLAKMNRFDGVRATERWAFFRGYIEGERRLESQRSWFALEILRTFGEVRARDIRKAMVDCTRENRNFRHLKRGSWEISERRAWPRAWGDQLPALSPAPVDLDDRAAHAPESTGTLRLSPDEARALWAARQALLRIGIPTHPPVWMAIEAGRKIGLVEVARLAGAVPWEEARKTAGVDPADLGRAAGRLFGTLVRAGCWVEPLSVAGLDIQFHPGGARVRGAVLGRVDRIAQIRPIAPRAHDPAVESAAERLRNDLRASLGADSPAIAAFDEAWRRGFGRWKRGGKQGQE